MKLKKNSLFALLTILIIWIVLIILSDIRGNFPLNDDWSYSLSVKNFIKYNKIMLTGWVSMPVVSQILWGSLFSYIFGFSYEVLRYSTLILGLIGIVYSYLIFSEISNSDFFKISATLLIAINPIYLLLSSTFMTDIPFFTFSIMSAFYFIKFLKYKNMKELFAAVLFMIIASFIRQIGIVLIISFALTYLLSSRQSLAKKSLIIISLIVLISAILLLQSLIISQTSNPVFNNTRINKFVNSFSANQLFGVIPLIKNSFFILIYSGLFLFPILFTTYFGLMKEERIFKNRFWFVVSIVPLVLAAVLLSLFNKLLPLRPNILWKYGLGPATLKDVDYLELEHITFYPDSFWFLLTLIGLIGIYLIVLIAFKFIRKNSIRKSFEEYPEFYFVFFATILHLLLISISDFFDRYVIQLLPGIIFMISFSLKNKIIILNRYLKIAVIVIIFLIAIFSTIETRNYFAWNRCRWQAIDYLTNELKINPDKIDGGFEFNALQFYDPNYIKKPYKSWWWVQDDEYIVSFGSLDGYSLLKSFEYSSYGGKKNIYILKRDN